MEILLALVIILSITAIIFFDYSKRIDVINKPFMAIYLLIYPNILLVLMIMKKVIAQGISEDAYKMLITFVIIGYIYMFGRINIFPVEDNPNIDSKWNVLMGGRIVLLCGIYTLFVEILMYMFLYNRCIGLGISQSVITYGVVYASFAIILLLVNGLLRIFFTSSRLGIKHRIIMLGTLFIPIVNIFVLLDVCNMVYEEYDYECNQKIIDEVAVHSYQCETKYPIVLVHGISLKDLRYYNYWGRIPVGLTMNGATIYYGHKESTGTILNNAIKIKNTIEDITKKTGCEKVNIIAHSRGGLDARYAITMYDLEEKVASLTTIGTPHKGSIMGDLVEKLPENFVKIFARYYDKKFSKLGNDTPDLYTALKQCSSSAAKKINDGVRNKEKVYYQSYASKLSGFISKIIYFIPYMILNHKDKENDGLVSVESAKFGVFKGVFENDGYFGISHKDAVDARRKDYSGFDIVGQYVDIVSELKTKGY